MQQRKLCHVMNCCNHLGISTKKPCCFKKSSAVSLNTCEHHLPAGAMQCNSFWEGNRHILCNPQGDWDLNLCTQLLQCSLPTASGITCLRCFYGIMCTIQYTKIQCMNNRDSPNATRYVDWAELNSSFHFSGSVPGPLPWITLCPSCQGEIKQIAINYHKNKQNYNGTWVHFVMRFR